MNKLTFGIVLMSCFATNAATKNELISAMQTNYKDTFGSKISNENFSQYKDWQAKWEAQNVEIDKFVNKNSSDDKDLAKYTTELFKLEIKLFDAQNVKNPDSVRTLDFVRTNAKKVQSALKSLTFVRPGKRDARTVLVELAGNIERAAAQSNKYVGFLKSVGDEIVQLKTLRDLDTSAQRVEAIAKEGGNTVNQIEQSKKIEDEIRPQVEAANKMLLSLENGIAATRKKLDRAVGNLEIKKALKEEAQEKIAAAESEVGYLRRLVGSETEEVSALKEEKQSYKDRLANLKAEISELNDSLQKQLSDPSYTADNEAAQKTIAELGPALQEIQTRRTELASSLDSADKFSKEIQASTGDLKCKAGVALIKQNQPKKGIFQCRQEVVGRIKAAAKTTDIAECLALEANSLDETIDRCAKAVGMSFP